MSCLRVRSRLFLCNPQSGTPSIDASLTQLGIYQREGCNSAITRILFIDDYNVQQAVKEKENHGS